MPADHRRESSAGSSRSFGGGGSTNPTGGRPRDVGQQGDPAAFVNAFWGPNDAGFPAIQNRMRTALKTMDELRAFYKERADIEAEYAKRLAKLSKSSGLGANETGAFRAALETVRFELDATSRSHASLSNMLRKELDGQVTEFQSKFAGARKNSAAQIEKLYKQKQTQEAYVNKAREKYEQDCIKINGYTAQSSLVQGRDLDKVSAKLDKAQATVGINDKDYQNFIKALKDTTLKWNGEWKVYLDQCQDLEEERLEFIKANMWNYANGVSAICVADDESCERVRVALENCDTLRDIRYFIQKEATGPLIPDPPEYINYARGQPPPSRPTGKQAHFTRTSERPMPIFATIASAVAPVLPPSAAPPTAPAAAPATAPLQPQVQAAMQQQQPLQQQAQAQILPQQQPPRGRTPPPGGPGGDNSAGVTLTDPGVNGFKPPPGAMGLPGMTKQPGPSVGGPERRLSRQEFLSRAPSLSMKAGASQQALDQGLSSAVAAEADAEDDPLAKALANLRAMQGQRAAGHTGMSPAMAAASVSGPSGGQSVPRAQSPAPPAQPPQPTPQEIAAQRENERAAATVASLPAKYQPPLLSSPYATASPQASSTDLADPHRRAVSPSPSTRSHASQHRPKSPSAVFMGAPPRSPSPLASSHAAAPSNGGMSTSVSIEDVVGAYGQAFPGERKALSRQNSSASRATSRAGSTHDGRPVSGAFQPQGSAGMAGIGARGRSPSPGPLMSGPAGYGRPSAGLASHHHSASQSSHAARVASNVTVTGAPGAVPPRSTTPLGITLDARGTVTHDQMAEEYLRRASSTAPGAQSVAHSQAPSHGRVQTPSVQAPPPQQQLPHVYQQAPLGGAPPAQYGVGQPPVSAYGQPTQPPAQMGPYGHLPQQASVASMYSQPPQGAPTPAPHLQQQHQQHQAHPSAGIPPQVAQPWHHQAATPAPGQAPAHYGYPVQHAQVPGQTPASAYMQQYLMQQQQPPPPQQQQPPQHQRPVSPAPHAGSVVAGAPTAPQLGHPAQQPSWAQSVHSHQHQHQALQQHPQASQQPQMAPGVGMPGAPPPSATPAPGAAPAAVAAPVQAPVPPAAPSVSAPTGQFSDAGHPILFYVKALYDYTATQASEFSFTAGDIIAVTHTAPDGWWSGEILDEARRRPGANTFPSNFVSLLS